MLNLLSSFYLGAYWICCMLLYACGGETSVVVWWCSCGTCVVSTFADIEWFVTDSGIYWFGIKRRRWFPLFSASCRLGWTFFILAEFYLIVKLLLELLLFGTQYISSFVANFLLIVTRGAWLCDELIRYTCFTGLCDEFLTSWCPGTSLLNVFLNCLGIPILLAVY